MGYSYTMVQRSGFTLFKLDPAPNGFTDVHLTISSDDAQMMPDGTIMVEQMWKRPHVTFCWAAGGTEKKLHAFIVTKKNKRAPSETIRDATMAAIFDTMMRDETVIDALFEPEKFIKA